MGKKGVLKAAAFLPLFIGLAAGVSAQITVSGGFALSMASLDSDDDDYAQADAIGFGGNAYLDWLLLLPIPLSLGLEAGYDTGETSTSNGLGADYVDRIGAIPLLARVASHFDLMPKLDNFKVVDRKSLEAIRSEQDFQTSGEVDDDSAVSIGKLLGANIVITGSITGVGSTRRLRLKALDVMTAEIAAMASEAF